MTVTRLRRTCHAVEVLHRLNFDAQSRQMVRDGGDWLINLPFRDRLSADRAYDSPSLSQPLQDTRLP